jgi:uncharacterized protein YecT (DUF1311 family)
MNLASGNRNFVLVLLAVLIIPLAGARADIAHSYVISSCDPAGGVARISSVNVFEGEGTPTNGSTPLESLPSFNSKASGVLICDLGPRRTITLKGVVDGDHPRNDGIWLYVNSRPMQYPISINSNVTITYDNEEFYVFVEQCGDDKIHCLTERITSPSFQCDNSNSKVERMICRSDALSADDVELAHAYRFALDRVQKPDRLIHDEVRWLKDRQKICNVPEWSPTAATYDSAFTCVKNLYTDRIQRLKSLSVAGK